MKHFLKSNYPYLVLLLFSVPLFFIAISGQQPWGDDYAQYIKEAQNIATGKPYYQSNYIYNALNPNYAPPDYPPGFPLLLVPAVKLFGLQIAPMQYTISFLLVVLLFSLYFYFKRYMTGVTALCLAIVTVYSGGVIDLKWHVLSDLPLLVFTGLYLLVRTSVPFSRLKLAMLLVISVIALLVRSQAILLLIAEAVYLLSAIIRDLRAKTFSFKKILASSSFRILAGSGILYAVCIYLVFPSPQQTGAYYANLFTLYDDDLWGHISNNFFYLLELLRNLLHYSSDNETLQLVIMVVEYAGLVLGITGLVSSLKTWDINVIFFILMCLLIVVLPVNQGLRYLLPVLPVYLLLIYKGARFYTDRLKLKIKPVVPAVLSLLFLLLGCSNFSRVPYQEDWTPYSAVDSAAFEFIRRNVKSDEIIVFAKPRALTLYTNKRAMNLSWQTTTGKNKARIDSMGVTYFLFRKDLDEEIFRRYIREARPGIDSQRVEGVYTLYRLR